MDKTHDDAHDESQVTSIYHVLTLQVTQSLDWKDVVLISDCVMGWGVKGQGDVGVPEASDVSHFVLLESLAVHNSDFDCPHTGDSIENEGIP